MNMSSVTRGHGLKLTCENTHYFREDTQACFKKYFTSGEMAIVVNWTIYPITSKLYTRICF